MKRLRIPGCIERWALGASLALLLAAVPAGGAVEVLWAGYRADVDFPQFAALWRNGSGSNWDPMLHPDRELPPTQLGGSIHIFLRNTGGTPARVDDVLYEGISLKEAITVSRQRKFKRNIWAASIYFSEISEAQRQRLIEMGEPIWWRAEPETVPPQGSAEIAIRLRTDPPGSSARVEVRLGGGVTLAIDAPITRDEPRIKAISFTPTYDQVFLYAESRAPGTAVRQVLVDGLDVTERCEIKKSAATRLAPMVYRPPQPIEHGSYHTYQAVFEDGRTASAGLRSFASEMMYGIWGGKPGADGDFEVGRAYLDDIARHNINLQMEQIGSAAVSSYMASEEGLKKLKELGITRVLSDPGKGRFREPHAFYLADEPDTGDYRVEGVPESKKVGCLAQGLLIRRDELRNVDPDVPGMTNINLTYKPHNWYIYGQVPDIYTADPYYQPRLRQAYENHPGRYPLFAKGTFVFGEATICRSASEPRPMHMILYANRYIGETEFRGPTPPEKRIEAYYALAAGANHLSFWWYTPARPAHGLGSDRPEMKALWREVGLMGAELRTASELFERSCPIDLPIQTSPRLWARALAAGPDTVVVLIVNDDYVNDRQGTAINTVADGEVTIRLPDWISSPSVFEVHHTGTRDVASSAADSGLSVEPGEVEVTRLLVITADRSLRQRLQQRYETRFATKVKALLAE